MFRLLMGIFTLFALCVYTMEQRISDRMSIKNIPNGKSLDYLLVTNNKQQLKNRTRSLKSDELLQKRNQLKSKASKKIVVINNDTSLLDLSDVENLNFIPGFKTSKKKKVSKKERNELLGLKIQKKTNISVAESNFISRRFTGKKLSNFGASSNESFVINAKDPFKKLKKLNVKSIKRTNLLAQLNWKSFKVKSRPTQTANNTKVVVKTSKKLGNQDNFELQANKRNTSYEFNLNESKLKKTKLINDEALSNELSLKSKNAKVISKKKSETVSSKLEIISDIISSKLASQSKGVRNQSYNKISDDIDKIASKKNGNKTKGKNSGLVFYDYSKKTIQYNQSKLNNSKKVNTTNNNPSLPRPSKNVANTSRPKSQNNTIENLPQGVPSAHSSDGKYSNESYANIIKTDKRRKLAFGIIAAIDENESRIYNFDIEFKDSTRSAPLTSNSNGEFKYEYFINNDYSVRRVNILSKDHVNTSFDLELSEGDNSIEVPALSKKKYNSILKGESLNGIGATVIFSLGEGSDGIEDVTLANFKAYEKKLYLNRNFNVVDRENSDFYYIMYIGVEAGNNIVTYRNYKNKEYSRFIYLSEDEVYFDFGLGVNTTNDTFELLEENLLSKKHAPFDTTAEEIVDALYFSKIKMRSFNEVLIKSSLKSYASRKYYMLSELSDREPNGIKTFIGRDNQKKVIVPARSYIKEAISSYRANEYYDTDCYIQINLSKDPKSISFSDSSPDKSMRPVLRALDTDGVFYKDISNETKRIFFIGKEQGQLNIKIEYTDKTLDYLQTYCSLKTNFIEQL